MTEIEGLPQTKEELLEYMKKLEEPLTTDQLIDILGSTVKHDNINKVITFLTMLLTYTQEDQINLGYLAESSTGKSYIPLELSWYFPKEDVIKLGYASPTAFFHEYGTVIEDPITGRKIIRIDLHKKILIFLDMPHDQLLQRLRSLLSHDEKQIVLKITDRKEKSGLRTKTVLVEGYPTVIFCSAKFGMEQQEKTRLLLLSPEVSQEKLRETIALRIEKESDREAFYQRMMEDPNRQMLQTRVWQIKRANIKHVKIPEELRAKIYDQFLEDHKNLIPRHQRDISRLLAIIKGHALLNYMHRERVDDSIIANEEDVAEGFKLYYQISEANELGLSPEVYNIYRKIKPYINENGITIQDFQRIYYEEFCKPIGYDSAREILQLLTSVGLLTEDRDPGDKRKSRYFAFKVGVNKDIYVQTGESEPHISLKNTSLVLPHTEKQNSLSLPHTGEQNISIEEVYEKLREQLREPFQEGKAISLITQLKRCDYAEAEKLFQLWVDEGKLFRDPYGLWMWNK